MITLTSQVLASGFHFLEGPRWHGGELWMVDIGPNTVVALGLDGSHRIVAHVPGMPSGLGFLADGTPLVVNSTDRKIMKITPSGLEEHADLSELSPFINDMVVGKDGRAYVGNIGYRLIDGMHPEIAGNIILVEPDGSASVVAEGLICPNGIAMTSDGHLVVAETFANRISYFPILSDGRLGERAAIHDCGGSPDGICIDADDGVWVSVVDQGRYDRLIDGKVVERVEVESPRLAVACQLGGEDGRTLFCLTFAGQHGDIGRIVAGRVEILKVDSAAAGSP